MTYYTRSALQRKISNYVNRVDVLIPKICLSVLNLFFISLKNKSYRSLLRLLWKGDFFGRNCLSSGKNQESTFRFLSAQFRCCCHRNCTVFAERNLRLGFQENVNNGIFLFSMKP